MLMRDVYPVSWVHISQPDSCDPWTDDGNGLLIDRYALLSLSGVEDLEDLDRVGLLYKTGIVGSGLTSLA